MIPENWKDVPGQEGSYQVSDLGQVRSVTHDITQASRSGTLFVRTIRGRVLRPGRTASGHLSVVVTRAVGSATVHSLVMLAFRGPPPRGLEVRHLDGDPANNRLTNLEYGTRAENLIDLAYHGQRKVSVADVAAIRLDPASAPTMAAKFQVSKSLIHCIRARKLYKHVP